MPGLAGKNIIDLLVAAAPVDIAAVTAALLALGFQPQFPAASSAWPSTSGRRSNRGNFLNQLPRG